MRVEVFKTDVPDDEAAARLSEALLAHFPGSRINFDLDDCDRILRVEGPVSTAPIIVLLNNNGYSCVALD